MKCYLCKAYEATVELPVGDICYMCHEKVTLIIEEKLQAWEKSRLGGDICPKV